MTNFKYVPYRNQRILDFARGQKCQHCGNQDETVVAAHSNKISDGKGVGKKADDCYVAYLCGECHGLYDRHKITQEEFDQAMKRTMRLWLTLN